MSSPDPASPASPPDRREFLKGAACAALGACAIGVPIVAGVRVLVAPIGPHDGKGHVVKLTTLAALPAGAAPLLFQVFVERSDAWTRHPLTAIGAVFLQRTGERAVRAFNASCPHLGCAVEWRTESKTYFCPCHTSAFSPDGGIIAPSPAARGLDVLEIEVREDDGVWVRFQDFKAGIAQKIAVG